MKKTKIAGILILLMLWLPLNVYGESSDSFKLIFDPTTKSITGFEGEIPSTVIIPRKINGVEVKAINSATFAEEEIRCIKIPDTLDELILANNHGTVEATEYNLYEYFVVEMYAEIEFYSADLYENFYFDKSTKTIIGYDSKNGSSDVAIPSKIDGIEVKVIGEYAFCDTGIESVTIPNTVTEIEKYAFYDNYLSVVTLPSSVEAVYDNAFRDNTIYDLNIENPSIKIYPYAFWNNDLVSISLPYTIGIHSEDKKYEVSEDAIRYFKIFDLDTTIEFYSGELIGNFFFDRKSQSIIGYSNTAPKDVVIPSKLDGVEVKKIDSYAFYGIDLTSVTIEEGITEISHYAFSGNNLSKVVLPNSLIRISDGAFYETGLTSIVLPNKLETLGTEAFAENKLKTVTIPASVKNFDAYVFTSNELTSVVLSEGLEIIGVGAFSYNQIASLDIPNTVVEIKYGAFESNLLGQIIIPPSVKKIGTNAFVSNGDYGLQVEIGNTLESIYIFGDESTGEANSYIPATIEDLVTYEVFDWYATINFYKEPKFGDFYFDKATGTVTGYGLTGSKDVVIPDKIDGVDVKNIGESVFFNREITSVVIPDTVETIGNGSFMSNSLKSIDLPSNLKEIGNYAFSYNNIENVEIPYGVTKIGFYAFNSIGLKNLKLPNSIKEIQENAFAYNELTTVEIPYSLERIGTYAFAENKIKRVELPSTLKSVIYISEEADYIEGAFDEVEPTIENLRLFKVFDDLCEIVFYDNLKFGNFYFDKETGTITGYSEEGSTDVVIPSEIEGVAVKAIVEYVFKDRGITSLVLSETIEEIGQEAFSSNKLKEVVLPNSLKVLGNGAFKQNVITDLVFSTSLVEISDYAFAENSLTTLTIPTGVTYIGISAFEGNKLTEVEIPSTVTEIGVRAFYSNNLKEIKLPESVVSIVGYVGSSTDKEKYELTKEQLINLKVFDETVEIKIGGQSSMTFIIIGVIGGLLTLIFAVAGLIVLKNKKVKKVDENNDLNNNERYSN